MAQLCCNHVTVGYEGRAVHEDINFQIHAGDYLCILGENGAGKSTTMKTLLGLLKPLRGEITFGDGMKANAIGYLPQQTVVQRDFPATVWEIVLSGCQARRGFRPFSTKADKALARENIQKMDITALQNRCYRELSGGQQQRVLLARALCATEKMLLLDEPVAGLDPKVTQEMYQLIARLNREEKVTIIMISHDVQAAVQYATHILHVGKENFFGTREEYLQSSIARRFLAMEGGADHA